MKPLDRYGPALIEYEGVADLTFPQESGLVYKGYFEAKQLTGRGNSNRFCADCTRFRRFDHYYRTF